MDWTEKCNNCAKSGHLINQGIKFACFDSECNYEPIQRQNYKTYSTSGIVTFNDEDEIIDCSVVEGQMVIDYQSEVENHEQETPEDILE